LLERYRQFIEYLENLLAASVRLADDPTQERLTAAEYAWRDARRIWKQTEIFKFGPSEEEPLRYGPKIDFWPVRPASIEAVLTATTQIMFDDLGAAAKGLPVVEYLLFSGGALTAFQEHARRHEYLKLVVEDLIQQAQGLLDAWDPESGNYLGELVDAGNGSEMFETLSMALGEVVNRMAFTVENIRADKLEAGIAADATPQPENLESQYSGRSVMDIRDNLRGIELLYFGDEQEQILALDDYLQHRGYQLGPRMGQAFADSYAALRGLDAPLSVAIVDAQDAVHDASDTLVNLQRLIQVDVIGALSLSVRFNDNDGD
jgi:predicted lipoprotein